MTKETSCDIENATLLCAESLMLNSTHNAGSIQFHKKGHDEIFSMQNSTFGFSHMNLGPIKINHSHTLC